MIPAPLFAAYVASAMALIFILSIVLVGRPVI